MLHPYIFCTPWNWSNSRRCGSRHSWDLRLIDQGPVGEMLQNSFLCAYTQVSEPFKNDTVKTSLSTFVFFIVSKFKALSQYDTKAYIDHRGKKLYLLSSSESNPFWSMIFCHVEVKAQCFISSHLRLGFITKLRTQGPDIWCKAYDKAKNDTYWNIQLLQTSRWTSSWTSHSISWQYRRSATNRGGKNWPSEWFSSFCSMHTLPFVSAAFILNYPGATGTFVLCYWRWIHSGKCKTYGRKAGWFFFCLWSVPFLDVSSMNFMTLISLIFIMLRNSQASEQENGSLMCFSITSSVSFVHITFFSYDSAPHLYYFHSPDSTPPPHYTFWIPIIKYLPYINIMLKFLLL